MKLKKWLLLYKNLSYSQYRNLSNKEKWKIEAEFYRFNKTEQKRSYENWRPMTEEESVRVATILEKERIRYETNLKIGGIDSDGNYTALHHRNS